MRATVLWDIPMRTNEQRIWVKRGEYPVLHPVGVDKLLIEIFDKGEERQVTCVKVEDVRLSI